MKKECKSEKELITNNLIVWNIAKENVALAHGNEIENFLDGSIHPTAINLAHQPTDKI